MTEPKDFIKEALKGPIQLKWYLYVTVTHLIFVEVGFMYLVGAVPEFEKYMIFVNYCYLCVVLLHGIHWFQKRLWFVMKMLLIAKPYVEALEANKDELGMSPEEMVALLRSLKPRKGEVVKAPAPDTFDNSIYAPVPAIGCPVCGAQGGDQCCIAIHAAAGTVPGGG